MNTLCFISEASENMMGPSYPVNTSILEFLDLFLLFFILFLESCLFFSFFLKSFYNIWPIDFSLKMCAAMGQK